MLESGTEEGARTRLAPGAVLVVEDEPLIRSFMVEALRRAGHAVLEAADAEAGLSVIRTADPPVIALVTDVRLPGMTGLALVQRARALRPGLRVLYVTGYAGDDALVRGSVQDAPCLPKPFRAAELLRALASVLGDAAS